MAVERFQATQVAAVERLTSKVLVVISQYDCRSHRCLIRQEAR